ncbi:MAG: ammonium transporter [Anaerolineae bacterium]|nr:ammonium transporter [Anaerolineae bacterium]
MDKSTVDILWVLVSAGLVFLMQAGFLCLETGLTRSKNNINVAIKNLTDFGISVVVFWACGYGFMFGASQFGWFGSTAFLPDLRQQGVWFAVFLLFQIMFCGTAVTILSGAVAERLRVDGYVILALLVSALLYPVFGHWAWNGLNSAELTGWLGQRGFVDFAGSTVVHSVGGWVSLATLLVIGSRAGRFPTGESLRHIPGSNIPIATLGVMLLWFGWFGFNGGSVLAMTEAVPVVIANTMLAGAAGLIFTLAFGWLRSQRADVGFVMNGALAGLVAITANAHAVSSLSAILIGGVGGLVMVGVKTLLERFRVDDAVDAIPVHLGAGVWGTLAVALFGQPELLGTGLSFWSQLQVQVMGILACFLWVFGLAYFLISLINRLLPLRVTSAEEEIGLNVSEHGATTELLELFRVMDRQSRTGDLSLRVPVEPFTEVGQIAQRYNQVMTALEQTVSRTKAIVRTAMDGIVTFSQDSLAITTLNPAAETIFGYRANEIKGRPVTTLLRPEADSPSNQPDDLLTRLLQSDSRLEVTGQRADGSAFPMEVVVSRTITLDEAFYTGTFRDITELRQTLTELETARDAAEAANRSKSVFLANMSHELRTPLNAIIGYSEMLQEDAEDVGQETFIPDLEKINVAGKHLLKLIDDVLDISKIEAGKMDLFLETFDLASMIEDVATTIKPLVAKNNNRLTVTYADDLGFIHADLTKVRQILFNLLSNAAKFTQQGAITLTAQRAAGATDIVFQVADTGIGLSPDQITKLFQEFTQADASTTRKYGGTGLGLALSRRFCQMMGGEISVESGLNEGTVFTVRLPARVATATPAIGSNLSPALPLELPVEQAGLAAILVIDDDPDSRDLLSRFLQKEGFQVVSAPNGEIGLRMARELHPLAITLDVMMAGMDGWSVLTALKADPELSDIPVIMLTMVSDKNMGYALGAADYLMKPINRERLLATLQKYRCAAASCRVLLVEDEPDIRELVRRTLEKEGWQVTEAENGRVALERMAENAPELILLDLMMPEMDGFQFITAKQARPEWEAIPTIIVTAMDLSTEERQQLNGSVQYVLQKGAYTHAELLQEVRRLVLTWAPST